MDNPQTWKQERPSWCPHTDCNHRRRAMDNACVGALPEPAPHDGDVNHYRLCLCGVLPDDEVFDLQVNDSDLHWLRWLFSALHEDPEKVRLKSELEAARKEIDNHACMRQTLRQIADQPCNSLLHTGGAVCSPCHARSYFKFENLESEDGQ